METELLAQIIEITSVGASGMQLKKPIKVPRPSHIKRRSGSYAGQDTVPADAYKKGVAVLAATSRGVRQ